MLVGHYFIKHHRGHFYAKAQNLSRKLRAAYDAALGEDDLLLMPTVPLSFGLSLLIVLRSTL
jgi:amidase